MGNTKLVKSLIAIHNAMMLHTKNWEGTFKSTLQYVHPNRDTMEKKTEGGFRDQYLFSGEATSSAEELVEHLLQLTLPMGQYFFGFTTGNEEVDRDIENYKWLQKTSHITCDAMKSSNFFITTAEALLDAVTIGTDVVYSESDEEDGVRYTSVPVWQVGVKPDAKGRIRTVSRCMEYSFDQLVEEYGEEALTEDKRREYLAMDSAKRMDTKFTVIHLVRPRGADDMKVEGKVNMPFVSYHILKDSEHILKIGGYRTFPYSVHRFRKLSDEDLGRSPAMSGLPDIRTLNAMEGAELQGAQLTVAPPMQARDNSMTHALRYKPFAMNYTKGDGEIKPLIPGGVRIDLGLDLIKFWSEKIEARFFLDKLRLAMKDRMTATEIIQRRDESFRGLASVVARWLYEYVFPNIDRTFDILWFAGKFPEAPKGLQAYLKNQGGRFAIKSNSMIDRAYKTMATEGFTRGIQANAALIQTKPECLDNLDVDTIFRNNMMAFDSDGGTLLSLEARDKIRKERQEMQDLAKQQAAGQAMQDTAKGMNEMNGGGNELI
jgi:hypothetical protein